MAAESNDTGGFHGYQSGMCTSSSSEMMIYNHHNHHNNEMGMMGMGMMNYFGGGGGVSCSSTSYSSSSIINSNNCGGAASCSASGSTVVGGGGGGGVMMLPLQSSMIHAPGMLHLPPATTTCASASPSPLTSAPSPASSSLVLDSVPGLNPEAASLAVEWSPEEQYKLEQGLHKYADEPSIMKYIKIAASLRDKTVRDVALRCRWMTRKRRKAEENHFGRKLNNRKDKLVESSAKMNMSLAIPQSVALYPLMMHKVDQSEAMPLEGISGRATQLLEQNAQAFSQISANLSTFKLQDNIELLYHARNNITAILNDMRDTPGIMSQMPPLPVSINEDLANTILPNTAQSLMFCSPTGVQLKQEPRC
ncbi:hypothetical protein Tsubulata_007940 [Turnera subulata]|uniref:Myb-like domain-containing protein n=1 Tax=Turnera subulata TaxID=218843 RepID=A0A9Q0G2A9_9ROSI|nr:hypothetical protein Tsubulata_007940 [Turnera subulata]